MYATDEELRLKRQLAEWMAAHPKPVPQIPPVDVSPAGGPNPYPSEPRKTPAVRETPPPEVSPAGSPGGFDVQLIPSAQPYPSNPVLDYLQHGVVTPEAQAGIPGPGEPGFQRGSAWGAGPVGDTPEGQAYLQRKAARKVKPGKGGVGGLQGASGKSAIGGGVGGGAVDPSGRLGGGIAREGGLVEPKRPPQAQQAGPPPRNPFPNTPQLPYYPGAQQADLVAPWKGELLRQLPRNAVSPEDYGVKGDVVNLLARGAQAGPQWEYANDLRNSWLDANKQYAAQAPKPVVPQEPAYKAQPNPIIARYMQQMAENSHGLNSYDAYNPYDLMFGD